MRIGLDTFCYQIALAAGMYDVFRLIDGMPSMGVEGLQININGPKGRFLGGDPGDLDHVQRVREALEKRNLFVEVAGRSTQPPMLRWQLELCDGLGADILRTTVELKGDMGQTIRDAADDLEAILPLAHELGVRIALENHEDLTALELISVIETVHDDHLGACLDTGNGICLYEDPVETTARLAPYAITSHIKDQRLVRVNGTVYSVGVGLGRGDVDLPEVIEVILGKSSLDRLLIQDTIGYSVTLNPFSRELGHPEPPPDVPEIPEGQLASEGILMSPDGLDGEELTSWAEIKRMNLQSDVKYLRELLAQ